MARVTTSTESAPLRAGAASGSLSRTRRLVAALRSVIGVGPAEPEPAAPLTGLILSGGGARAAYQVGVLRAIANIRREAGAVGNPFPIVCGTSAGAINAAALACGADDFDAAVTLMRHVWSDLHAAQVYRADSFGVVRSGARWLSMLSLGWALARWRRAKPRSLLDNAPLQSLLAALVPTERLELMLRERHLHALAVSASSYTSGLHVTFYQSRVPIEPWNRSQRIACRAGLTTQHLLASAAIPFIFPAVPLEFNGATEWFGDGSMRQAAPISPAVHLGADRILVIGAARMNEPPGHRTDSDGHPSVAQIAGHALSSIFLDALAVDVERLTRINHTLSLIPAEARRRTALRPIKVLVIAPSQRLDDLAALHIESLPVPVRALLRGLGVSGHGAVAHGAALTSFLLFEAPYTRALLALGEADTMARKDDVLGFFGWDALSRGARQRREAAPAPGLSAA